MVGIEMKQALRAAASALALIVLTACATQTETAQDAQAPARTETVSFAPATPEQGATILSANDEYLSVLSPADLSIRLQGRSGTGADLGRVYAGATQAWNADESERLRLMVVRHRARLNQLATWLPDTVYFIKGTRAIEGGIPHTRGPAIFFGPELPGTEAELDGLFMHELFHVLSRESAARHDDIYGIIGFVRCEAVLPQSMTDRTITNPDAPAVEHASPISESDTSLLATPLLFADPGRYDPSKQNLGQYFDPELQLLRRGADGKCRPAEGVSMSQDAIRNAIFARSGRNTNYMFHPEELMADNFSQMMMGQSVSDPWVHERLAALLGVDRPARRP
ncbi:hypothetical protein U91I_02169 [alpha proteobacterium U9-1i]|nr:hypothetical protein U91I_02169 [alpha proteobacterium U9-1i]